MNEPSEFLDKITTKEFFRGGTIAFAGFITSMFLNYVFNALLARWLGEADYGIFVLGFLVFQVIYIAAPVGLDHGVVRFVAIHYSNGDRKGTMAVVINSLLFAGAVSLCFALGLFALSGWLAGSVYHEPDLKPVLILFAAALFFTTPLMVVGGALQGLKRLDLKTLLQHLLEPGFRLGGVVILLMLGLGLKGVILAYPVSYILTIVLGLFFLRKILGWHGAGFFRREYYEPLMKFSAPLILGVILASLTMRLDRLFLGYFVESKEVGLVHVCNLYAMMVSLILYAFNLMFAPFISSLHNQKKMDELGLLLKTVARWMALVSAPIFVIIVFYNRELLSIFGQYYVQGGNYLVILALGQLLSVILGSVGLVMLMTGHSWIEIGNLVFGFVLFVILNLVLIPRYGALGAVIANASVTAAINIPRLVLVRAFFRMHPYSLRFLVPLVSAAVAAILAWSAKFLLQDFSRVITLFAPGIIFIIIYLLLAFFLGLNKSEKDLIRSFLRRETQ